MKREPFVAARNARWERLERLLGSLRRRGKNTSMTGVEDVPRLYRQVCQDLALARHRMYGRELVLRLNQIALDGREQLYRDRRRYLAHLFEFVRRDFPRLVRAEAKLFWLATALYVVPLVLVAWIANARPDLLYTVMDQEMIHQFEEMYDPTTNHPGRGREADSSVAAFAFYIMNNVSWDFRTFASGLAFGVGTIFILLLNAVVHGGAAGHLIHIDYDSTFFPFVVGHSSLELTAFMISAAAGLRLGFTLIAPGRRSRSRALVEVGPHCLKLLAGAALMTIMAGFIEGFWSPSSAPVPIKFAVGAVLWTCVTFYFLFAGRGDGSRAH